MNLITSIHRAVLNRLPHQFQVPATAAPTKDDLNYVRAMFGDFYVVAQVFDNPSHYGINYGRVSRLKVIKRGGALAYNYDRGNDVDEIGQERLAAILNWLGHAKAATAA